MESLTSIKIVRNIKSKLKLKVWTQSKIIFAVCILSLFVCMEIYFETKKLLNISDPSELYCNKAYNSTIEFLWERKSKIDLKSFLKTDFDSNRTSCYLLDFLSGIDPSLRTFDRGTMCDDLANVTDILCRIYLRQIGVDTEHEREACLYKSKDLVPKFVYFVTFGEYTFQMWNYIAVVAAQRHVQPTALYVIGDQHPRGPWWELVIRDVPGLSLPIHLLRREEKVANPGLIRYGPPFHVNALDAVTQFIYRQSPKMISGKKITMKAHMSDIVRLQILYLNGGIYLDTDQVVLRNLDELLVHNLTMGSLNRASGMGTAFIISKRHGDFIKEWYQNYTDYHNNDWGYNSMKAPDRLYQSNTSQINLITDRIYRPQYWELPLLLNESLTYDWRKNYAMHIWTNHGKLPKTLEEIQTGNSTVKQVFRYILYGDQRPRTEKLEVPGVFQ